MFVFEDIGWILLTTVIFILFHFLFEKILHFKSFTFLNVMFWRLEIMAGIYYAVTTLAIEALIWQFAPQFALPTGVLTSLAIVTLRSPLAAIINIFPSLIFYTLLYDVSILTYVVYGITLSGMTLYVMMDQFISKQMVPKVILIVALIIASITAYFFFLVEGGYDGRSFYESTLLFGFLSGALTGAVSYFMLVFKSANILFDSVTYAYFSYYRHAVAWIAIQNLIKRERIKNGVYIVFKYHFENNISQPAKEELARQFLQELEKSLPKNAIPFVIEQDLHGIFFPVKAQGRIIESLEGNYLEKRNSEDILRGIEKMFHRAEREYFSTLGERSIIKAKAGASLYGLQDSSLVKLEQNAIFAANSLNSKAQNAISLYNYKKLKGSMVDSKSLLNMDYALSLDNFENELIGVYSLTSENWVGLYSQIENASEFNLVNSVREHIKMNNWASEFDRYFAVNTLQEFSKNPLKEVFFHYSPILLNPDLDFYEVEGKIEKFNLKAANIVFILDEIPREKFQFENIENAKKIGFKIAFQEIFDKKIIDSIEPNWIIISPKNFDSIPDIYKKRTIFGNISSLENLKLAKKNGAIFYSGSLLQEEDIAKDLDILPKKSKITLKQLINETEKGGNYE